MTSCETRPLCQGCIDAAYAPTGLGTWAAEFVKPRRQIVEGTCPHCGWTREQAKATALFGCPLCYEVFADLLDDLFGIR